MNGSRPTRARSREQTAPSSSRAQEASSSPLQKRQSRSARVRLPAARKQALEELIEERLKLQEAKRLSIVDRRRRGRPRHQGHGRAQQDDVAAVRRAHGEAWAPTSPTMRERIRASLSWRDVIRRKFGQQITVAKRDVDRMVATRRQGWQDDVELQIHRILLSMPAKLGSEASRPAHQRGRRQLRAKFSGCKSMPRRWRAAFGGARFENLGDRKPDQHCPSRRARCCLSANDDELLPPTIGENGVELWAVCGRKAGQGGREASARRAERAAPEGVRDRWPRSTCKDLRAGRPHRVPLMAEPGGSSPAAAAGASRMGDPAGIGPEITLRAGSSAATRRSLRSSSSPTRMSSPSARALLGLGRARSRSSTPRRSAGRHSPTALPVLPQPAACAARAGHPDAANAAGIIAAIEAATARRRARGGLRRRDQPDRQARRCSSAEFPLPRPHRVSGRAGRAPFRRQALRGR